MGEGGSVAVDVLTNIGTTITKLIEWGGSVVNALFTDSGALSALTPFLFVGLGLTLIHFFVSICFRFSRG